jgi:hypothetical protein
VDTQSDTGDGGAPQAPDERCAHLFLVLERARPLAGGSRHVLTDIQQVLLGRGRERSAKRHFVDGVATLDLRVRMRACRPPKLDSNADIAPDGKAQLKQTRSDAPPANRSRSTSAGRPIASMRRLLGPC